MASRVGVVEEIRMKVGYEKIVRCIYSSTTEDHMKAVKRMVYNYHTVYGNILKNDIIADRSNTLLCLIKLRREVLEDLGDTFI